MRLRREILSALAALCVLCGNGFAQQSYAGIDEKVPVSVGPQPVPFSHRKHAVAGAQCLDCHTTAASKERAGIPQADRCKLCHPSTKLPDKIAWLRIYKLPDFVFFSHASHTKTAAIECATCHGPVGTRDVLQKEVSTSMRTCVDCHRIRKASADCSRCHELGQ